MIEPQRAHSMTGGELKDVPVGYTGCPVRTERCQLPNKYVDYVHTY